MADLENISGITGEPADEPISMTTGGFDRRLDAGIEEAGNARRAVEFSGAMAQPPDDAFLHDLDVDPLNPAAATAQYEAAQLVQLPANALDDTDVEILRQRQLDREQAERDREQYPDLYETINGDRFSRAIVDGDLTGVARVVDAVDSVRRYGSTALDAAGAGWEVDRARMALWDVNFRDFAHSFSGGLIDPPTPEQLDRRAALEAQSGEVQRQAEMLREVSPEMGVVFDATSNMRTQLSQLGAAKAVQYGTVGAAGLAGTIGGGGFNPVTGVAAAGAAMPAAKAMGDATFMVTTAYSEIGNMHRVLSQVTDENGNRVDPEVAAAAALVGGIATTAVEYGATMYALGRIFPKELVQSTPIGKWAQKEFLTQALKSPTTRRMLKHFALDYAKSMGAEGLEETVQNFIQDIAKFGVEQTSEAIADGAFKAPDASMDRVWLSVQEAGVAGWRGTWAAGLSMAPVATANATAIMLDAKQAQDKYAKMTATADAVASSKAFQNSKIFMQDFLRQKTGGERVSLEPRALQYLAQKGDAYAALKQLGATDEDIASALQNGTDVSVDAAALYAMAAEEKAQAQPPAEGAAADGLSFQPATVEGLLMFTRATQHDLTAAEAATIDIEAAQAKLDEELAAVTPFTQQALQLARETKEIEDEIADMVRGARIEGKPLSFMSDEYARTVATQISRTVYSLARRTDSSPREFYGAHKLSIAATLWDDFQSQQRGDEKVVFTDDDRLAQIAQVAGYTGAPEQSAAFLHATRTGMTVEQANEYAAQGAPHYAMVDHYGNLVTGEGIAPLSGYGQPAHHGSPTRGISGIKYLDGTSRREGKGSYNYVVFDGADTQITKTYYQQIEERNGAMSPHTLPAHTKAAIKQLKSNTLIKTRLDKVGRAKAPTTQLEVLEGKSLSDSWDNVHTIANTLATFLRDDPQEQLVMVVADKNGKIANITQHRLGSGDASTVGWNMALVGSAFQVKDAHTVWLAHNHPSGIPTPSQADHMFNGSVRALVEETGQLTFGGHFIIGDTVAQFFGDGKYFEAGNEGTTLQLDTREKAKTYTESVPLTRRTMRRKGDLMDAINNPTQLRDLAMAINEDGVLLLNTQHQPVGFVAVDPEVMGELKQNRDVIDRVMAAVESANAGAVAVLSLRGMQRGLNLGSMLQAGDMRVLDVMYRDGIAEGEASRNFYSTAEKGISPPARFFQPDAIQKIGTKARDKKAEGFYDAPIVALEDLKTGMKAVVKFFHGTQSGAFNAVEESKLREGAFFGTSSLRLSASYLRDWYEENLEPLLKKKPVTVATSLDEAKDYFAKKGYEVLPVFDVPQHLAPYYNGSMPSYIGNPDEGMDNYYFRGRVTRKSVANALRAFDAAERAVERLEYSAQYLDPTTRTATIRVWQDQLRAATAELDALFAKAGADFNRNVGLMNREKERLPFYLMRSLRALDESKTVTDEVLDAATQKIEDIGTRMELAVIDAYADALLEDSNNPLRPYAQRGGSEDTRVFMGIDQAVNWLQPAEEKPPTYGVRGLEKGGMRNAAPTYRAELLVEHANNFASLGRKNLAKYLGDTSVQGIKKDVILPLYAKVKNPLVIDAKGARWAAIPAEPEAVDLLDPRIGGWRGGFGGDMGVGEVSPDADYIARYGADRFTDRIDDENTGSFLLEYAKAAGGAFSLYRTSPTLRGDQNGVSLHDTFLDFRLVLSPDEKSLNLVLHERGDGSKIVFQSELEITELSNRKQVEDALRKALVESLKDRTITINLTRNTRAWAKYAQDNGHDAVVFHNVWDAGGTVRQKEPETVIALLPAALDTVRLQTAEFKQSGRGLHFQSVEDHAEFIVDTDELLARFDAAQQAGDYATMRDVVRRLVGRWADAQREEILPSQILAKAEKNRVEFGTNLEGFAGLSRYIPDRVMQKLKTKTAEKVLRLWRGGDRVKTTAALAAAGKAKKGWYVKSARGLVELFGVTDAPRVAAVMTALSPKVSVQTDVVNTFTMFEQWVRAGRPADEATIRALYQKHVKPHQGVAGAAAEKGVIIALSSQDPVTTMLGAPKTDNFSRALLGATRAVVLDVWMARAMNHLGQDIYSGSATISEEGQNAYYIADAATVTAAAEYLTQTTGEVWTPAEVQETVWSYVYALYELKKSADFDGMSFVELAQQAELIDASVTAVPDVESILIAEVNNGGQRILSLLASMGRDTDDIERVRSRIEASHRESAGRADAGETKGSRIGEHLASGDYQGNLTAALQHLDAIRAAEQRHAKHLIMLTGVTAWTTPELSPHGEEHQKILDNLNEWIANVKGVADVSLRVGEGIYAGNIEESASGDVALDARWGSETPMQVTAQIARFARDHRQMHALSMIEADSISLADERHSDAANYPALRISLPEGASREQALELAKRITGDDALGGGASVAEVAGRQTVLIASIPDYELFYDSENAVKKYAAILDPKTGEAAATVWRKNEYERLESWLLENLTPDQYDRIDRADMDIVVMDQSNYERYIGDEEGNRTLDNRFDARFGESAAVKIRKAAARAGISADVIADAIHDAASQRRDVARTAAILNQTLGQPTRKKTPYRGALDTGDRANYKMYLFEAANRSTIPHEVGHLMLHWLADAAQMPNADPSLGEMLQGALDYLGATSIDTMTTEQHERFADGALHYFMTSKAPTMEMRQVFDAYRRWLTPLYKRGLFQTVQLSPEIRAVFDRLVATDDALAAYEDQSRLYRSLVDASRDLYSGDDEREQFLALAGQAAIEAREGLLVSVGEDIDRAASKEYRDTARQITAEVKAQLEQTAAYKALVALTEAPSAATPAPLRLDRNEVTQTYGVEAGRALDAAGALSGEDEAGLYTVLTVEEAVAATGMDSDRSLLEALAQGDAETVVERAAAPRIAAALDTLASGQTAATRAAARDALHNATAGQLLEQWRAMLLRKAKGGLPRDEVPVQALRLIAERAIATLPREQVHPDRFAAGEVRAVKMAVAMHAKGDDDQAAQYARLALYEHERFRAARNAEKDFRKLDAKVKQYNDAKKRARLAKLGNRALMQIDSLMRSYNMLRRPAIIAPDLVSLEQWSAEMSQQTGAAMAVDPAIANGTGVVRSMSLEKYEGVVNHLIGIEQQARAAREGMLAERRASIAQTATELSLAAYANAGVLKSRENRSMDAADAAVSKVRSFIADHSKMEFVFRRLDGWQNQGVWWKTFYEPLMLAANQEAILLETANARFQKIFADRFTPDEVARRRTQRLYSIPAWGRDGGFFKFTHEELLSVLLNMGNDDNVNRMEQTLHATKGEILAELNKHLTREDYEIANEVWAALDEIFWDRVAKIEEVINGVPPKKVEASPFTVTLADGSTVEMRGGYYPLMYDGEMSTRALEMESEDIVKRLAMPHASAQTQHGHREKRSARVNRGLVVKLGLSPLARHIANVSHDVTHALPLIDAWRLLKNPEVDNTLRQTLGEEMRRQFIPWLQAVANEYRPYEGVLPDFLENYMRRSVATVAMGYKLTTAMVQPLGYTISADYLLRNGQHGGSYAIKALGVFKDPAASYQFMVERSVQMRNRRNSFSQEVRDFFKDESVAGRRVNAITKHAMILASYTDLGVSMATWHAAYNQALDGNANNVEANDERAAIEYADAAVRLSQGSGLTLDTAGVQRNHRMLSMFSSYWITMGGAMRESGRQFVKGDISRMGFAVSMLFQWFLPAALEGVMRDMFRDDDEEDEEKLRNRWATRLSTYPFQQFLFVRDVANYMAAYAFSDYPPEYELTPVTRAIDTTLRGIARGVDVALTDDEASRRDLELFLDATGYALHLPTAQLKASGGYLYDVFTGAEPTDSAWRTAGGVAGLVPSDNRSKN